MRKYKGIRQTQQNQIIVPQINQYVFLHLKNNLSVEGKVLYWSDYKAALQLKNNNTLIIHQTLKNVILIQIKNEKENIELIENNQIQQLNLQKKQIQEPIQFNSPQDYANLKLKKLSELKAIQVQQEKENFTDQSRSFTLKEPIQINYEKPGIFKQHKR